MIFNKSLLMNCQYIRAVFWFLISIMIGVTNDVITKHLGGNIPSIEIVFFRFLFGSIFLIPIIMFSGKQSLYSENRFIHLIRGFLLFGGIWIWSNTLKYVHVATATVINFTIPIFVLILARLILRERVDLARVIATIVGFIGVIIVVKRPDQFDVVALFLLFASFMFALLDVINKKYVAKESMLAMILYSNLVTLLFTIPFLFKDFVLPTFEQFMLLAILGIGANLLLYFLLKAFALADSSSLAPFRYFEIIFSGGMGYIIFNEIPSSNIFLGSLLIIPSTLFITFVSSKKRSV